MKRLQPSHSFQSPQFQKKHPKHKSPGQTETSQKRLSLQHNFGKLLTSLGQLFCHISLRQQQPNVRWKRNRQGQSFYEVYDPQDHSTHHFETITETRAWLETRYYR